MSLYLVRDGKVTKATPAEELAATALFPEEFGKRLGNQHGLARRFAPIDAWTITHDKPERVRIVEVRGSGCEWKPPVSYALTEDGRLISAFYLFPVAKHKRPELALIKDQYGECRQWVAPLRANCKGHW